MIQGVMRGKKLQFKTSSSVFSKEKIDFGTKVLVEAVDVKADEMLLDVGCGYGVIGISLSFFCDTAVLLDINARACQLSKENIWLNRISNAYVICGSPPCVSKFEVVAMNPPLRAGKKVVFQLIEESKACLTSEGRMYLVARTRQGAKSIYAFMEELFSSVSYASLKGGYRVIEANL